MRSIATLTALALLAPAAGAQDAKAHYDAGMAHFGNGDHPAAIAELTQSIRLDPSNATAWKDRGRCRYLLEDAEGAIADYTRAIEIDPTFKMVYNNRAAARRTIGDLQGAIADCDRALELDPRFDYAYLNRALVRFHLGDSPGGRADVAKALELGTTYQDYPQLWLWTDRVRRGEAEAATKALADHVAARGEALGDWEAAILGFLLGDSSEEDLFAASAGEDVEDEGARACEAHFYAAMKRFANGDRAGARDHFQKCVATSRWTFGEYGFSVRMLEDLAKE